MQLGQKGMIRVFVDETDFEIFTLFLFFMIVFLADPRANDYGIQLERVI